MARRAEAAPGSRSPEHVFERFKRMGVGDVAISAITFEGLILVTNNVRGFQRVPDLRIENWIDPPKPRPRGKHGP